MNKEIERKMPLLALELLKKRVVNSVDKICTLETSIETDLDPYTILTTIQLWK